jgi:hypothetical protein
VWLKDTLFVGWEDKDHPELPPLDELLKKYGAVREAVTATFHREISAEPKLWPHVATLSFVYAFNTYKAIGLVLPHLYHEAASAMLRQLWEVSLNLHWMEKDPDRRAQDFCNFTVMEMRKQISKGVVADASRLEEFDEATGHFQSKFRFADKRGRKRSHDSFAASNIENRAKELEDPWETECKLLYSLTSMHAHGAPGAILRPTFFQGSRSETMDKDSASLVAITSMQLLVRDAHLMGRQDFGLGLEQVDSAAGLGGR